MNPKNSVARIVAMALCLIATKSAGRIVRVHPTDSLAALREKLEADAGIAEVIFEAGVYSGSLHVSGPQGTDFSKRPLLIRAADGANVSFNGAKPVEKFQAHGELAGVFWIGHSRGEGEPPKLWEPRTRVRYRLAADRQSVARFPASFTIEGKRLFFHTSDGQPPRNGDVL